ncbi:MAG: Sec-independent protein translocase protein TatB [Campylobacterota bacterium]|nr:Sec-independent protein translocase protein TatB [Campylobacterota bacterium]
MFGMGFMEIFLVAIVAIIALGPEKLPSAMVDIAKFFKKFKSGIENAKSTLDNELNISQMKEEADKFKASVSDVKSIASVDLDEITSLDVDNKEDTTPQKEIKKAKIKRENHQMYADNSKKETIRFDQEENKA